ncbi:MAG: carbamate kinase [Eubacteriales bacterium]|nr:carbamate kinase [Eubacteriales bacterium]
MSKRRIAVALGGNALGESPADQLAAVRKASVMLADMIAQGHELIISHGNGPQVGMIHAAMDLAACSRPGFPAFPFAECAAMSQGYIGYHLQQALGEELRRRSLPGEVLSVVTQVVVDPADPAFQDPRKPIGRFFSREAAEVLAAEKGWIFREDAGRGYRRVIPSPAPLEIVEQAAISRMLSDGITVIAAGGGGIPVIRTESGLQGVDAVIDKDRSCERLAEELGAELILFLTAVDRVCLNFRQPDERPLTVMSAAEARAYIRQGHFAPGSMLPKVEAGLRFAESAPGRRAVITSLEQAPAALTRGAGTWLGG